MAARVAAATLLLLAACSREAVVEPQQEPRPPVEARAAVDRAVATTGDLITYRITVERDPELEVQIPEAGAEIAGFRIVDAGVEPERRMRDRLSAERWYRLRADLVGSYVLPPVRVAYHRAGDPESGAGVVETSAIFVEVESVLPVEGGADDIRDIKPLRPPPARWPWVWITAVAALAAAAAVYLVIRRRRGAPAAPPVPAHEVAFAALDRLRQIDFDDRAEVRRFYFAISETIRAYVEARFGLNATDLTTEEIVASLAALEELASGNDAALRRFLSDTDLVKFAHRRPLPAEIEATYERALGFVEATRPRSPEELERQAAAA